MKVIVRLLIAIVLVLVVIVIVVGPGRIVAGVEYPFGVGPWSSTGRYCHNMYGLTRLVDQTSRSGHVPTSDVLVAYRIYEKDLTTTGPHVPRADFTAFFHLGAKEVTGEGKLLNSWWNANCADAVMNASASASHATSGVMSHVRFTHYPKNVLKGPLFFNFPSI